MPIESNPDVLNDFSRQLGVDTAEVSFCDVYGLDSVRHAPATTTCSHSHVTAREHSLATTPRCYRSRAVFPGCSSALYLGSAHGIPEAFARLCATCSRMYSLVNVHSLQELLAMVPQPVKALVMLFPITPETEAAKEAEEVALKASGQTVSENLWFTKQTISNACGTVGMLHAFANNSDIVPQEGSFLARYLAAAADMDPGERARFLEFPKEGEPDIEEAHQGAASGGQTAPPAEDEVVRFSSHGHVTPVCGMQPCRMYACCPHRPRASWHTHSAREWSCGPGKDPALPPLCCGESLHSALAAWSATAPEQQGLPVWYALWSPQSRRHTAGMFIIGCVRADACACACRCSCTLCALCTKMAACMSLMGESSALSTMGPARRAHSWKTASRSYASTWRLAAAYSST